MLEIEINNFKIVIDFRHVQCAQFKTILYESLVGPLIIFNIEVRS